jgi:hypothetical protein
MTCSVTTLPFSKLRGLVYPFSALLAKLMSLLAATANLLAYMTDAVLWQMWFQCVREG